MAAFGVLCICVMLILLVVVLKALKGRGVETRNIIFDGREFEVYLSSERNGRECEVSVWEVVHPNRKFFRTKYRCCKTFSTFYFKTIKEGVYAVIDSYIKEEQIENLIKEKWNEVE